MSSKKAKQSSGRLSKSISSVTTNTFSRIFSLHKRSIVANCSSDSFSKCEKLETIVIPFLGASEEEVTKLAYFFGENPTAIQKVTILGGSEIPSIAFRNCNNLVQVVLPNTIKSIGTNAFYGLKNLVAVNIPSSVRKVENSAFEGCSKLLTITVNKTESSTASWGNWNPDNCQVVYE